jgi:hypothetical protein
MNFKNISDQELLKATHLAVAKERAALFEVARYLIEVEGRKLYALNYSSMFEFATRELKLSEGQAQRRIDCARLMRELPSIEGTLKDGKLNLSHISIARSFFRSEKKAGRALNMRWSLNIVCRLRAAVTVRQSISVYTAGRTIFKRRARCLGATL